MVIGICFTNMTFPPQGGRCPAGADEGALSRTKKEIYFTDPPSSVICFANATFPLKGGKFIRCTVSLRAKNFFHLSQKGPPGRYTLQKDLRRGGGGREGAP